MTEAHGEMIGSDSLVDLPHEPRGVDLKLLPGAQEVTDVLPQIPADIPISPSDQLLLNKEIGRATRKLTWPKPLHMPESVMQNAEPHRHIGRVGKENKEAEPGLQQYLKEMSVYPIPGRAQQVELAQRIERGNLAKAKFVTQALVRMAGHPAEMLDKESVLYDIAAGDQAFRDLYLGNLRLVASFALRNNHLNVAPLVLIQEGNIGLKRAVEKYNWRKGFAFSTYATGWIRQFIERAIDKESSVIPLPNRTMEIQKAVERARRDLRLESLRGEITPEELAEASGLSLEKLRELEWYKLIRNTASLDAELIFGSFAGDSNRTLQEVVADPSSDIEEEIIGSTEVATIETDQYVEKILNKLPEREREIIRDRMGLNEEREIMTLQEIGKKHGFSRERARQIEVKVLTNLQRWPAVEVLSQRCNFDDDEQDIFSKYVCEGFDKGRSAWVFAQRIESVFAVLQLCLGGEAIETSIQTVAKDNLALTNALKTRFRMLDGPLPVAAIAKQHGISPDSIIQSETLVLDDLAGLSSKSNYLL